MLSLDSTCRCEHEIFEALEKSGRDKHAIGHTRRERVSSIHYDVSALLKSSSNIYAAGLQTLNQALLMSAGGDNHGPISSIESCRDEPRQVIKKLPIIRIKHRLVPSGGVIFC
jgi:hypothetical protein